MSRRSKKHTSSIYLPCEDLDGHCLQFQLSREQENYHPLALSSPMFQASTGWCQRALTGPNLWRENLVSSYDPVSQDCHNKNWKLITLHQKKSCYPAERTLPILLLVVNSKELSREIGRPPYMDLAMTKCQKTAIGKLTDGTIGMRQWTYLKVIRAADNNSSPISTKLVATDNNSPPRSTKLS
ncbi:hypothetical protein MUK42_05419 [Musa troglodytarum]|uniref:Uncharacterized protein n=1 Tax=Musa troglodytarum TaxID=320322 RepID=A0A9E7GKH5_9LILI|nr:hypothetical protein MUK42_05419 [Musa troglodytarum]